MDREALRNVFPSLGRVRSIRDILDRIAELARGRQGGERIVTMPIWRSTVLFRRAGHPCQKALADSAGA
jgi:hypothetical protein